MSGLRVPARTNRVADGCNVVVVGRRRDRLDELVAALPDVSVRPMVADLASDAGVDAVADVCANEALAMLVASWLRPFSETTPFTSIVASGTRGRRAGISVAVVQFRRGRVSPR